MRFAALVALSLGLVPATALAAHLFSSAMQRVALGQHIREYGPNLHEKKGGTPTMGGVVILVLWGVTLGLIRLFGPLTTEAAFVFVAGLSFGAIGLLDDLISLGLRRSLGLRPWQNLLLGSAVSAALFLSFSALLQVPLRVPFSAVTLSLSSIPNFLLAWLVFLCTTNSMNLTDGLDGLASGVSILILAGFLVISPGAGLASALLPLGAILVGFLWVNGHPARLFLGNVGSFFLGGVVGACALVSGTAFLLPLLAGLLVLEGSSVVLQVASFRLTGQRVFKIAPLHHHFERAEGIDYPYFLPAVEWPEPKVTLRLWIVQGLFVGLAILAARL
jgi:phospho-N-acetylmuramoyl-pentapeptide-transferase